MTLLIGSMRSLTFISLILLGISSAVHAQTSSSTNYMLTSQSATNCGGGHSSSTNYKIFDTLCEQAGQNSSSTNYSAFSGFQAQTDVPQLTVSYSASTLSFADLKATETASTSMTVTVNTNAPSGYQITILADGNFRKTSAAVGTTTASEIIAAVSDGAVNTNGNEYGFSTSSTDLSIPTSTPRVVNANTAFARNETTTITLKAGVSETNSSGLYTQNITIVTAATF